MYSMDWYLYVLLIAALWNWVSLLGYDMRRQHPNRKLVHCLHATNIHSDKARLRGKARQLEADMVAARVAHHTSQQQLDQAQQAVRDTQDAQDRLTAQLQDNSTQLQVVCKDLESTKYAASVPL